MIQASLVEYIASQLKAGVSRDAVRSALIGVGWQAADVDDTFKKVDADMKPAAAAPAQVAPMAAAASPSTASSIASMHPQVGASPVQVKPMESVRPMAAASSPATRMGSPSSRPASPVGGSFSPMDLVGGGGPIGGAKPVQRPAMVGAGTDAAQAARVASFMSRGPAASPSMGAPAGNAAVRPTGFVNPAAGAMHPAHHVDGEKVGMIAEAIGLVALLALSLYFYNQMNTANTKLAAATANGAATTSDLSTQAQTLTVSNAALSAQVQTLMSANADIATQLSFFATPTSTAAPVTGTVGGVVTASVSARGVYAIRTAYNAVIFIKNSSDAKLVAALKPLVGQQATVTGTYIPGSDAITVTAVNNQPINAPVAPVVTTTTATSTGK